MEISKNVKIPYNFESFFLKSDNFEDDILKIHHQLHTKLLYQRNIAENIMKFLILKNPDTKKACQHTHFITQCEKDYKDIVKTHYRKCLGQNNIFENKENLKNKETQLSLK